jgi:tail tube GTA-gp10-like protein
MANPQKGEVALKLGGQELAIRVSLNTLAECQEILGESDFNAIMKRLQSREDGTVAADFITMRALLCACLRDHFPTLTPKQAGGMVAAAELTQVMNAIGEALNLAFRADPKAPGAGEDADPLAPTQAPGAGPSGTSLSSAA